MHQEIRKVPPNWEHPKNPKGNYRPMVDKNYEEATSKWLSDFDRVRKGELTKEEAEWFDDFGGWLMGTPYPHAMDYRPYQDAEATWFQAYETKTIGTPITPPFATKEELRDYLVKSGDFSDQFHGHSGWGRAHADYFILHGIHPLLEARLNSLCQESNG